MSKVTITIELDQLDFGKLAGFIGSISSNAPQTKVTMPQDDKVQKKEYEYTDEVKANLRGAVSKSGAIVNPETTLPLTEQPIAGSNKIAITDKTEPVRQVAVPPRKIAQAPVRTTPASVPTRTPTRPQAQPVVEPEPEIEEESHDLSMYDLSMEDL